jgi:photosystem II stability/assembly factor-like uncharacterized protein
MSAPRLEESVPASAASKSAAPLWRVAPAPAAGVQRSDDGGKTWATAFGGTGARIAAVSTPMPNVCWAVGAAGTIVRTANGVTWERIDPPDRVDLISVEARDSLSATVQAADARRFETRDGGLTWMTVP